MRFVTTLHAYDLMDTVHATVVVRRYEETEREASSIVFECTTTVPGIGENDPNEWLRDVLVAVLEDI
jgi:hypothetical protein